MPSSLWMLDRAERLFETAKTAATPAEANSLRRMGANFLAGAEANGVPAGEIRARFSVACPAEQKGEEAKSVEAKSPVAEQRNNVVFLAKKRAS